MLKLGVSNKTMAKNVASMIGAGKAVPEAKRVAKQVQAKARGLKKPSLPCAK